MLISNTFFQYVIVHVQPIGLIFYVLYCGSIEIERITNFLFKIRKMKKCSNDFSPTSLRRTVKWTAAVLGGEGETIS